MTCGRGSSFLTMFGGPIQFNYVRPFATFLILICSSTTLCLFLWPQGSNAGGQGGVDHQHDPPLSHYDHHHHSVEHDDDDDDDEDLFLRQSFLSPRSLQSQLGDPLHLAYSKTLQVHPVSSPPPLRPHSQSFSKPINAPAAYVRYDHPGTMQIAPPSPSVLAGQVTFACPNTFHLVKNKCVKTVIKPPKVSCPYGSYRNAAKLCIAVDSVKPEKACPPGFEPYEYGCLRRLQSSPLPVCPDHFHIHPSHPSCIRTNTVPPERLCHPEFTTNHTTTTRRDPMQGGIASALSTPIPPNDHDTRPILRNDGMCEVQLFEAVENVCPDGYKWDKYENACISKVYKVPIYGCSEGYTLRDRNPPSSSGEKECVRVLKVPGTAYCADEGFILFNGECFQERVVQKMNSCPTAFILGYEDDVPEPRMTSGASKRHLQVGVKGAKELVCYRVEVETDSVPHCREGWEYDAIRVKCTKTLEEDPVFACMSKQRRLDELPGEVVGAEQVKLDEGDKINREEERTVASLDEYHLENIRRRLNPTPQSAGGGLRFTAASETSSFSPQRSPSYPSRTPSTLSSSSSPMIRSSPLIDVSSTISSSSASSLEAPPSSGSCVSVERLPPVLVCPEGSAPRRRKASPRSLLVEGTEGECVEWSKREPSYKLDCSGQDVMGESQNEEGVPICLTIETVPSEIVGCGNQQVEIDTNENIHLRSDVCAETLISGAEQVCPLGTPYRVGRRTCKKILTYPPQLRCPHGFYLHVLLNKGNVPHKEEQKKGEQDAKRNEKKTDSTKKEKNKEKKGGETAGRTTPVTRTSRTTRGPGRSSTTTTTSTKGMNSSTPPSNNVVPPMCISQREVDADWQCPEGYKFRAKKPSPKEERRSGGAGALLNPSPNLTIFPSILTRTSFDSQLMKFDKNMKRYMYKKQPRNESIPKEGWCERVEFASVQVVCPLGYRMEKETKKKQPGKGCVAEKQLPATQVCEPGFFMQGHRCIKHVEVAPSIVTPQGDSIPCQAAHRDSTQCGGHNQLYHAPVKEKKFPPP